MCSLFEHIERESRARAEAEATPIYEATVREQAKVAQQGGRHANP